MAKSVTCSFDLDSDVYNTFESIIEKNGESVKDNLVKYMESVIQYDIPNADTLLAIKEVEALKKDPNAKVYHSFDEMLKELNEDE